MALRPYLQSLLGGVDGCLAILIYDTSKEQSPLFRVGELSDNELNAIKQNLNIFNSSIERVEKLCKANSSKTIMAFYNHHQIYIFSKATLVFVIVASSEANAGMMLNLRNYLEPLVAEIQANPLHETASQASFSANNLGGRSINSSASLQTLSTSKANQNTNVKK